MAVRNVRVERSDRPKNKLYEDVPETEADDAWNVEDRSGKLGVAQTAYECMIAGMEAVGKIRYVSYNTCQVHALKCIEIPYRIL